MALPRSRHEELPNACATRPSACRAGGRRDRDGPGLLSCRYRADAARIRARHATSVANCPGRAVDRAPAGSAAFSRPHVRCGSGRRSAGDPDHGGVAIGIGRCCQGAGALDLLVPAACDPDADLGTSAES